MSQAPQVPRAVTARPARLRDYVQSQLVRLGLGSLCLLGGNLCGLLIPWLLKLVIDALHGPQPGALSLTGRLSLAIVGLAAAQAIIRTASRILIFNCGRDIEYRLRRDVFEHVIRLPQSFHRNHATGDLMSRMTSDLSAVRMLFGPGILNLVNTAIVYVTGLWLMTTISPTLTVYALIPLPLVVAAARMASRRVYIASRTLQDLTGDLSTHLQEDLTGVAIMRSYTLQDQRAARFDALNEGYLQSSLTLARIRGLLGPIFSVAGGIGTLAVLWIGGRLVIEGRMTVGELVAFSAYLGYLAWPTLALGWVLSMWQRGLAGWDRVRELLVRPIEETGDLLADEVANRGTDWGTGTGTGTGFGSGLGSGSGSGSGSGAGGRPVVDIEARGLNIVVEGREILKDVSFRVRCGESLAIVGPTGSGKTTLADALLRLTDVPADALFVGGRDVTQVPLSHLRALTAYAPQDPFLFSASVARNIAFGRQRPEGAPDAEDDPEIAAAAENAGLARDLGELPQGIRTVVGERGIMLSGGQRQRVALARALYAESPIVVLDDSLSSVDAETEQEILQRLRPRLADRTAILISHRIAAVKDVDQILVLDGGRITERGTHTQLCDAGGTYARLYREQLLELPR